MSEFRRKTSGFHSHGKSLGRPLSSGPKRERRVEHEILELRMEKMVQGGNCLARLDDGRICFVSGALPGELCRVEITFRKKDFLKGRAMEILEANEDRVEATCPLYGKCGGCSLMHLKAEKQVEYLEQVERENFKRLSHAELPPDFKIHYGKPFGYRNRARVVAIRNRVENSDKSLLRFGFRKQESSDVVLFRECPVLTQGLNEFLRGDARKLLQCRSNVDVNVFDNGAGEISFYYDGMPSQEFEKYAQSHVTICGRKIESDASVFFQSNLDLLPELVESVRNAVDAGIQSGEASDEWLIDLFSGVGFFAALLQDKFKKITTVERDPGCLKHAKVNLSSTKGEPSKIVENVSAPAEEWLRNNVVEVPATLIVDPPRTGLPVEALEAIIASSVNRLIYVSCDPVTLARDYSKFALAGFSLKQAEGFAFYPETAHLEMMLVLSR